MSHRKKEWLFDEDGDRVRIVEACNKCHVAFIKGQRKHKVIDRNGGKALQCDSCYNSKSIL